MTSDAVIDRVRDAFAGQNAEFFINLSIEQGETIREVFAAD